jgi:hypothetical protein
MVRSSCLGLVSWLSCPILPCPILSLSSLLVVLSCLVSSSCGCLVMVPGLYFRVRAGVRARVMVTVMVRVEAKVRVKVRVRVRVRVRGCFCRSITLLLCLRSDIRRNGWLGKIRNPPPPGQR